MFSLQLTFFSLLIISCLTRNFKKYYNYYKITFNFILREAQNMLTFTNENNHNFTLSAKYWSNVFQKTHTHTFWEILFLCKGTLINSLNKKEKEMNKYDVALIHPQDIHKFLVLNQIFLLI